MRNLFDEEFVMAMIDSSRSLNEGKTSLEMSYVGHYSEVKSSKEYNSQCTQARRLIPKAVRVTSVTDAA